jgi:hypothetical protein
VLQSGGVDVPRQPAIPVEIARSPCARFRAHAVPITRRTTRGIASNHCVGIAVDVDRRLLYWTQKGAPKAGEGRIFRASLDLPPGTSAQHRDDIQLLWKDLPEPVDLHLVGNATLAWTDRGAEPSGNTLNRAIVQPTVGTPQILSTGYREAIGLTAVSESEFYVSDLGGSIRHVNLDSGLDIELVHLGPGPHRHRACRHLRPRGRS